MDKDQYDKLVVDIRERHLSQYSSGSLEDEIARVLYEEIDKEFIAAGQLSQAEHEAQIIVKMMEVAASK